VSEGQRNDGVRLYTILIIACGAAFVSVPIAVNLAAAGWLPKSAITVTASLAWGSFVAVLAAKLLIYATIGHLWRR